MKHKQEVKKAAVNVVMPTIKLTIQDLAYMNSMLSGAARCYGSEKTQSKLLFLGLIEPIQIPPCPKEMEKFRREFDEALVKVKVAVEHELWNEVANLTYPLRRQAPQPKKDFGLTKSGIEFIEKGHAMTVTAKQGGCK